MMMTTTVLLRSSSSTMIVFAAYEVYWPIDYDAVVRRSTFLLIFSAVRDCADGIIDGCWWFVVVLHYCDLDQTMKSDRCAAISLIYTCSGSISLSTNYRQMHKILVHYLRDLKTTLSRWNQIQINLSVFMFRHSIADWVYFQLLVSRFSFRRDGFCFKFVLLILSRLFGSTFVEVKWFVSFGQF